jgi:hypothetical protein
MRLKAHEAASLYELLFKIRPFTKTDFYCDKLATSVLLQTHLDSESVENAKLTNFKIDCGLLRGSKLTGESEGTKGDLMEDIMRDKMG